MFRIRQYMDEIIKPTPLTRSRKLPGPVVIWNLIRRCNLACKHCYSISADYNFPDELSTADIFQTMDRLKAFHVPVLILSGGEPLLHPDIFKISKRAKEMGFYLGLSTNGTLIKSDIIGDIKNINYNYVGISIDGIGETHDNFRRRQGAYEASINAIRLCRDNDIKVGIRFTLTQDNAHELPKLLDLMDSEDINKFYLSHLNYSGRGNRNRRDDATHIMTREALDLVFDKCWEDIRQGKDREYVTGNNDADAVYLLHWVNARFPDSSRHLRQKLVQWGGNSSGVNVANIDNLGEVHPDTFWWHYKLGNVRDRDFAEIWNDCSDPIMAGLKQKPRKIKGRCGECHYFDVCGGNARIRAWQLTADPWAEDPACYLTDEEIGIQKIASDDRADQQDLVLS